MAQELNRASLRDAFCELISAYSEDRWCAGWMTGVEKTIREQGGIWIGIAYICGGWPIGYRGEDGWDPLTQEEIDYVINSEVFKDV